MQLPDIPFAPVLCSRKIKDYRHYDKGDPTSEVRYGFPVPIPTMRWLATPLSAFMVLSTLITRFPGFSGATPVVLPVISGSGLDACSRGLPFGVIR